jgi:hypothetical protein
MPRKSLKKLKAKLFAEHIRINKQGYDSSGRYWGVGQKLYRVYDDHGFDQYIRASDAKAARHKVSDLERWLPDPK